MKTRFDWKTFLKSTAVIAIPVALQNLLTTTGSMIDTMMIGSLGELSVGAVGLCAQFTSLMLSCYWGLLGGGILFFSQYWGAKDEDGIDRSYGLLLVCMLFIGITFCILATVCPGFIMSVYTDKQEFHALGIEYLRIVGFAYPLQVFSVAVAGLLRSTERVKIPLFASIASVLTNLGLNWVLIYGRFGLPALGVRGAAIATLVSAAVNVLVCVIAARATGYPYLFQFRKHFMWDKVHTMEFFAKCFPIICNELGLGIANLIINMVLGRQAAEAIAALAVFRTFEGMIIAFFSGFSSASAVLVGKSVGAGEHEHAFQMANRLVYVCAGTIFLACVLLFSLHKPLLTAMGLSGKSFYYGTGMLLIYIVIAVFRMSNWISNDTCRASGDAITGTVLEIAFMFLLDIPVLCLAGLVWKLPFFVVFTCSYMDDLVRFFLMQVHMHSGGWIRPVTDLGKETLPAFRKAHPLRIFWTKMGLRNEQPDNQ